MPYAFNPLPWKFDKSASVASGGGITQLTTQDATAVTPTAGNVNISADDSTENNSNGIRTVGSGSTVTIELTNRLQGTATSTSASNADIITFDLKASTAVYRFKFLVAGRSTAGNFAGEGVCYTIEGSARSDGASATLIGTPYQDADEDTDLTDCTLDLVASGNNVIVRAVGIADETISYSAVGEYVVV